MGVGKRVAPPAILHEQRDREGQGGLDPGGSAPVSGKSADGTWWYIDTPGGHGWVSGSVVTASCIPASLVVVAAPPTPLPPSGTCKDGYIYRLIIGSDKVCVTPASKAQADADNAANSSRKLVTAYGPDACKVGFVWRDAFSGDHVCVTAAVRSQAAADNAAAASRVSGSDDCISGYVWRQAFSAPASVATSPRSSIATTSSAPP